MSLAHGQPQAVYEIQILGQMDRGWESVFSDLAITQEYDDRRRPTTTLSGPVADQAALRGILCRLWDLNLTLVSVRLVEAQEGSARHTGEGEDEQE